MKKQYINPEMVTIKVEAQAHILSFSESADGTINAGGNKGSYDSSMGQASRGGGGWDDED